MKEEMWEVGETVKIQQVLRPPLSLVVSYGRVDYTTAKMLASVC